MKRYIITFIILILFFVGLAHVMVGYAQETSVIDLMEPAPKLAVFDQQTNTFQQMDKAQYVQFVDTLKEKAKTKTMNWNDLNDALAVLNASGEPIVIQNGNFDKALEEILATESAKYK